MGENLVLNDGCVILNIYVFDGEGWDLGKEDAAEGIGDGGVYADQGERCVGRLVLVELDLEARAEAINRKRQIFARIVAREVGRGDMGDSLFVDADSLFSTPVRHGGKQVHIYLYICMYRRAWLTHVSALQSLRCGSLSPIGLLSLL